MPTYDYRCRACGHELEEFQSIKDRALRTCPKCKKPKLERLIGTGAGILFKGGGFYQTDYRSESYKAAESAEKGGGDKGGDAKAASSTSGDATASKRDGESPGKEPAAKKDAAPTKPRAASGSKSDNRPKKSGD